MRVADLPLAPEYVDHFERAGIEELYPPQVAAVEAGVCDGDDVVAAVPTASGKTFVAELALLTADGPGLYVCPLRALAREKYEEFDALPGVDAGISTGDYDSAASDLATASERARQAEQVLRNGINHRDTIDMVALVTRALAAAETDGLRVETDLPDEAWIVGTATIEEAVLELVANARSHVTDPTIRISVERLDETVKLVIADDGPGLPEHERRALAEGDGDPLSHSTGLGLWLVRWAITAAGGQVTVRDDTLGGTAIVLSFPQAHPTTR